MTEFGAETVNQMGPTGPCDACGVEITARTFLLIEGKCYHESCARCVECGVPLNAKCYFRDGMLFCKADYSQRYTPQCERCQGPIDSQTLIMNVRESVFHLHCFSCVICGEMLRQGEKFLLGPNGSLTCYLHMGPFLPPPPPSTEVLLPPPPKPEPVKSRARNLTSSKSDSQDDDRESSPERSSNSQKTKRMRTSFKHHQLREMKRYFQLNHNPDAKDLKGLAQKTGLTKRVLQVWFQNARAKYRRSQANNPDGCTSPNGCILPQVKLEQCYSTASASGGSARTSISPFEGNTNSSYSRSISPENRQFEEHSAAIAV
uniref:Uncharacterized protein n=1 Tax=Panagrolaimus sp. JU765 TaxID=591449 RepID=A0AC34PXI2_9BILA